MRASSSPPSFLMERNIVTQRIAVGLTLLAALFASACGDDPKPQPAEATLVFRTQPGSVRAGEVLGNIEVALVDSSGNVLTDRGGTVQLTLAEAPAGTQLGGATRGTLNYGVVRFTNLTVAKSAANLKLAAQLGAQAASSAAFTVRPAAPAAMSVTSSPTDVDIYGVLAPVGVTLRDAYGNIPEEAVTVTVALEGGTAGATLSGNTRATTVAGVATFPELSIDEDGEGYVLAFSSGTLTSAKTAPFKVRPAVPARLSFTTQPAESTVAGATLAPVTVSVLDSRGKLAKKAVGSVTVELVSGNGATLAGTLTAAVSEGVATFDALSIRKAGAGYTLRASFDSLTAVDSTVFAITPAAAARLTYVTAPGSTTAGVAFTPAVQVALLDAFDNLTDSTATVAVGFGANPGSATLNGTLSVSAVNGVATFADLSINVAAQGYSLEASSGQLAAVVSGTFDVAPAAAAALAFTGQPSNAVAGAALAPAVEVTVRDAFGNTVPSTDEVTLAGGSGAVLGGTVAVAAVNGVARFFAVHVQRAGTGYTLRATSGSLTEATSSTFAITAAEPAKLVVSHQPSSGTAGVALSPGMRVSILDAFDNLTDSTAGVTVALSANPAGGVLLGTVTESAVAGVATFGALRLEKAGTGYSLRATAEGLSEATSTPFDIVPAAPASLTILQQPGNIAAGDPISPAVQVAASDAFGNRATNASGNVSLALGTNPSGASLTGTTEVALSNGVASFADLSVNRAGTGYTLSATLGSVPAVTSSAFDVALAATTLVFVTNPGSLVAGNDFTPVVQMELRDEFGNRAQSNATVTLRLANNPTGATLSGTVSRSAVDGVVQFPGVGVRKAGTGYTLEASAGGLTSAVSSAFNVATGPTDRLVVTQQPPETVVAGTSTGTITVEVQDAYGNLLPTFGNLGETMSAGVDYDRNPNGASVSGTREVNIANGIATFTGLSLDKAGDTEMFFVAYNAAFTEIYWGYSRPVAVTPAAAAAIAFNPVPATTPAGLAMGPAVQVRVTDRFGNATSGSGDVTLVLGANPGRDTLRGTLTAAVTDGVASFADLVLQKAGQGYTLKASLAGTTPVTSAPFAIVGGAPTRVEFIAQPRSTPNGLPLNEVAVRLVDAFDNTATSEASISLALGNANGAVLGGTAQVAAQAGVARFTNLTVDRGGEGYVLAATADTLVGADSNPFNVYSASLAYTDPAAGRIRLMRNPASTNTRLVLDVVAAEELSGYGVGFNLPLDATKVRLAAQGAITAGAILSVGASVPAVAAALPASGPLSGVLTSGISQKASGSGSVATDTAIPAGSVLYQLAFELAPGAEAGVVFDGANLGNRFKGLLRNKLGDDVVGSAGFGIGRLEIAADAGFQKTAQR